MSDPKLSGLVPQVCHSAYPSQVPPTVFMTARMQGIRSTLCIATTTGKVKPKYLKHSSSSLSCFAMVVYSTEIHFIGPYCF